MLSQPEFEEIVVREICRADLAEIAAIQAASPEASQWPPEEYLKYGGWVAEGAKQIHGFLAWHDLGTGQLEILNLAVAPELRGCGTGRALVEFLLAKHPGEVFLEVRESNRGARAFYLALGFHEVGSRRKYYENPSESAIVMRFHSC